MAASIKKTTSISDKGTMKLKTSGKQIVEHSYDNGDLYIGKWVNGKANGHGKAWFGEGCIYEGEFVDGKPSGHGKGWTHGTVYEGHFVDGAANGMGTCKHGDGDFYTGEFKDGMRHGYGKCVYATGDVYDGVWEKNAKCGKGTCIFKDGKKYEGNWKDGFKHGYGVDTDEDGMYEYKGMFKKGKRDGKGLCKCFTQDGVMKYSYEGEWKDDLPHGYGEEEEAVPNRNVTDLYKVYCENGKIVGDCVLISSEGEKMKGNKYKLKKLLRAKRRRDDESSGHDAKKPKTA